MELDLATAAGKALNALRGKVRAQWSGGTLKIDERALIGHLADAIATVMGQNLYRGLTPDGRGAMPGRKEDGRPRGKGAAIARALAAIMTGSLEWFIAAHKERPGHLARIMRDVPLRPPPLESLPAAVIRRAFERARDSTGALGTAFASAPLGAVAQAARGGRRPNLGRALARDKLGSEGVGVSTIAGPNLAGELRTKTRRRSAISRALSTERKGLWR